MLSSLLSLLLPAIALISPTLAQNTTSNTVQNIFLQSPANNDQFVASVVGITNGLTTYAIACTSGTVACVRTASISVTEGANTFGLSSQTEVSGATALVQESCTIAGTTSATCIITIAASAAGVSSTIISTTTIGTAEFHYAPVTITAGAEKLASAAAAAATVTTPTTSSSLGGAAAAARVTGLAGAAVAVAGFGGLVALL